MSHGNRDQLSDAPTQVVDCVTGKTGKQLYGNTVFGVSPTEAKVTRGVANPGWVKVKVGTGSRTGRKTFETLVASRFITTDATSFSNTSTANVANTSGTTDNAIFPNT